MKTFKGKDFWNTNMVTFFIAPLFFLCIVPFIGFQIFYNREKNKLEKKRILLLSAGSLFYGIVVLFFVYYSIKN